MRNATMSRKSAWCHAYFTQKLRTVYTYFAMVAYFVLSFIHSFILNLYACIYSMESSRMILKMFLYYVLLWINCLLIMNKLNVLFYVPVFIVSYNSVVSDLS